MRIEPPPSPPVANGTSPPATAAALPLDDPPTLRPWRHGLCVTPFNFVTLTFRPPNSLAVVSPTGTAPPVPTRRSTNVLVWVAMRSRKTRDPSVAGHPVTDSSSFTPTGSPPKGRETSARSAACNARSPSRYENALSELLAIAASDASSSSRGERSPWRNASTSEHASSVHVASVTGR